MKKILMILCCMLAFAGVTYAQQPKGERHARDPKMFKEVQDFKVKFLADEMELNAAQKEKFTELYSKLQEEKHRNFSEVHKLERKVKNNANATEADYKELSDKMTEARDKDAQIEKAYEKKFSEFLSAKQIYTMRQGEDKFRRKMQEMHAKKCRENGCDNSAKRKKR